MSKLLFIIVKSQSAWDVQSSHSCQVKVLDFAPFRRSYLREFELSHSKLLNRIIEITQKHNLHVKMLVFRPFTIRKLKTGKFFTAKFSQTILRNHPGFIITLQLNYVSCNVKVDNLTIFNICETVFNSDNLFRHVLKAIAS